MTNLQSPEWKALGSNALKLIESQKLEQLGDESRKFEPLIRLWKYPSFGRHVSLTIFRERGDVLTDNFVIKQVTWDRPADAQRFSDPLIGLKHPFGFSDKPSVELREVKCQSHILRTHLHSLALLNVRPFSLAGGVSIDGIQEGIDFVWYSHRCLIKFQDTDESEFFIEFKLWRSKFMDIAMSFL